jgi:hypothetical protein
MCMGLLFFSCEGFIVAASEVCPEEEEEDVVGGVGIDLRDSLTQLCPLALALSGLHIMFASSMLMLCWSG